MFDFSREGKRPDGSVVKLAFSLASRRTESSPDVRFAVCQHYFPENFWNPAFQLHANGATRVPGAVLVADNPTDHHVFLKAFTGVSDLHSNSPGITVLPRMARSRSWKSVAFRDLTCVRSRK